MFLLGWHWDSGQLWRERWAICKQAVKLQLSRESWDVSIMAAPFISLPCRFASCGDLVLSDGISIVNIAMLTNLLRNVLITIQVLFHRNDSAL